jgi:hypothetical protein
MKKKNIGEIIRESTNRHAKYRCLQRYGFELNSQKRYEVIRQIQNNRAKFVESQSNSRSIFLVEIDNASVKVVYDKNRKVIRTVLPM